MKNKKLREHFDKRYVSLTANRESWVNLWENCCKLTMPDLHLVNLDPKSDAVNSGSNKYYDILNGIGVRALNRLASGMQSSLTNPSTRWFKLSLGDPKVDDLYEVKTWLYNAENVIYRACAKSNFYNATHGMYKDLGTIGSGVLVIVPDKKTMINSFLLPAGSYCLGTSHQGFVDTLYRKYAMTALQMVMQFGLENVSEEVRQCIENSDTEKYFNVMHVIEPNKFRNIGFSDNKNMPFINCYYEADGDNESILELSGFEEQPFFGPRWTVNGTNVYGSSPAMEALGDLSMLQALEGDSLEGILKQLQPPMTATPDVKRAGINSFPNGVTYITDKDRGMFAPSYQVNFDLQGIGLKIDKVERNIKESFYNDLFNMLSDTTKRMTAYETQEKMGEKLMMLGSVADRLQYEYLDLVIDRIFNILNRDGHIEPAPQAVQGKELNIEYIGVLAQARKGRDANNIISLFSFAGNIAGAFPNVLHKLNSDNAIDIMSEVLGVHPKVINSKAFVEKTREQLAQQQQQQQQMVQEQQAIQGAELMSKTSLEGNNALTNLIQGGGM